MLSLVATTVVLLSIDGLEPDYVLEAGVHGLRIPHLRSEDVRRSARIGEIEHPRATQSRSSSALE